ncbi:nitroreductase family deazaflavin-dependent oxidoreductase [Actinopolymorpha sp. B11F2]|uniref:nitroreductase family deazaflavin-dependent oxidoreductase n=1 Tax=Actinopolymorpha sp. B11F2 TaxID=3160862 RepID=UPI0032E4147C
MSSSTFPPPWLKWANKIIIGLQRLGLPFGTMHLLTVPGRRTGAPRTTPVSPYTVDGQRYVVAGQVDGDWAKNVRAAGNAILARGRRREDVRLVELPVAERGRILREFPVKVPHGVTMFLKTGTVESPTPEGFEAAAQRCGVFRIERL